MIIQPLKMIVNFDREPLDIGFQLNGSSRRRGSFHAVINDFPLSISGVNTAYTVYGTSLMLFAVCGGK